MAFDADTPRRDAFSACLLCGAMLCVAVWHRHGGPEDGPWWEDLAPPVNPMTGAAHRCEEMEPC